MLTLEQCIQVLSQSTFAPIQETDSSEIKRTNVEIKAVITVSDLI